MNVRKKWPAAAKRSALLFATAAVCAKAGISALAGTVTITASDSGWYNQTGFSDPAIGNYVAGLVSNVQYRDFFSFNIPALSNATSIVGAQLRLENSTTGYAGGSTETYSSFDVSTSTSALLAGGSGKTSIYNDLGGGTSYGSTNVSAADNVAGKMITIDLNSSGRSTIFSSRNGAFNIGGAITTISGTSDQHIFATTGGTANGWIQQLKIEYAVAPPPSAVDLGEMFTSGQAVTGALSSAGAVNWYKFNFSGTSSTHFLDIDTLGSSIGDTEIGLYNAYGTLIATDDDGEADAKSLLSFGSGGGSSSDNGALASGIYYLAFGAYDTVFGNDFGVTSSGNVTGNFNLNFTTNVPSPAGPRTWVTAAGGNWSTNTNWSPAAPPNATDDATFNLSTTYAVTIASNATANNVYVDRGNVNLALSNNSILSVAGDLRFGHAGFGVDATISGPGIINVGGRFDVGDNSITAVTVSGGAVVNATSYVLMGDASQTGTLNVVGPGSKVTSAAAIGVGDEGSGALLIADGGEVSTSGYLGIASVPGTVGTMTIGSSSANVSKASANSLTVGGYSGLSGGAGTLDLNSGGQVTINGLTRVTGSANSRINLAGGSLKTGSLDLGGNPSRFNWFNAGKVEISNASIGFGNTNLGSNIFASNHLQMVNGMTLAVSGNSQSLYVGDTAAGTLELFNGARLEVTGGGDVVVGNNSTGTLNVTGANSLVDIQGTGRLFVGSTTSGSGTVNVDSSGAVNVTGITKVWNGTSKIILNGGKLSTGSLDLLGDSLRLNWTSGTLEINNSDTTIGTGAQLGTSLTLPAGKHLRVADKTGGAVTGLLTVPSTGSLNVTGGSVYARSLDVANANTFTFTDGTVTVDGGQLLLKPHSFTVLDTPAGHIVNNTFDINGSGSSVPQLKLLGGGTASLTPDDPVFIGHSGNKGAVSIDGANSRLAISGAFAFVGYGRNATGSTAAEGTLALSNGGQFSDTSDISLGFNGGSAWTTVDGANSKLEATLFGLQIGNEVFKNGSTYYPSTATLTLTNGGQAFGAGTSAIGIAGGKGLVSVNGATLTINKTLRVGFDQETALVTVYPGTGTLAVSNGGSVTTRDTAIGSSGGVGTVSISGPGTRWANNMTLSVGADPLFGAGVGTLVISNNASLSNGGMMRVYSGGTLIVNGGSLTTHDLDVVNAGSFSFNDGTIIVNGGNFQLRWDTFSINGTTYPASYAISGTGTPTMKLVNSATTTTGANYVVIGHSGNTGALVVDGNGSSFATDTSQGTLIGESRSATGTTAATGTLTLSNGGQFSATTGSTFAAVDGGTAWVSVSGTNSKLTSSTGAVHVGFDGFHAGSNFYASQGTLSVSNGGEVNSSVGVFAGEMGASGWLSVDGANSKLTSTLGRLDVGSGDTVAVAGVSLALGSGTLNMTNGAQANVRYSSIGSIGIGVATINASTLTVSRNLSVGFGYDQYISNTYRGQGALYAVGGASLSTGSASIGVIGGTGTVSLSGVGTRWTNTASLNIGNDGSGDPLFDGTGTLAISNGASLANGGLLKVWSGGTVLFNGGSLSTNSLDVAGGHVLLSSGHDKLLKTGAMTISAGGLIDLSDNNMLIDYTSPLTLESDLRGFLSSGELISSSADSLHALAYADNAALRKSSFAGASFTPGDFTQMLVMYTYRGDANLDGMVDIQDLQKFIQGFNHTNKVWTDGDFDYDGDVDRADLSFLARNWQAGVGNPLGLPFDEVISQFNSVPEPGNLAVIGIIGLIGRRRKCSRQNAHRSAY